MKILTNTNYVKGLILLALTTPALADNSYSVPAGWDAISKRAEMPFGRATITVLKDLTLQGVGDFQKGLIADSTCQLSKGTAFTFSQEDVVTLVRYGVYSVISGIRLATLKKHYYDTFEQGLKKGDFITIESVGEENSCTISIWNMNGNVQGPFDSSCPDPRYEPWSGKIVEKIQYKSLTLYPISCRSPGGQQIKIWSNAQRFLNGNHFAIRTEM
jgi:hypothetical protein